MVVHLGEGMTAAAYPLLPPNLSSAWPAGASPLPLSISAPCGTEQEPSYWMDKQVTAESLNACPAHLFPCTTASPCAHGIMELKRAAGGAAGTEVEQSLVVRVLPGSCFQDKPSPAIKSSHGLGATCFSLSLGFSSIKWGKDPQFLCKPKHKHPSDEGPRSWVFLESPGCYLLAQRGSPTFTLLLPLLAKRC